MIDINDLLDLALIGIHQRDPSSLSERLAQIEKRVDWLLGEVEPTILNQIPKISQSDLFHAIQPTGALNRIAWVVTHRASGKSNSLELLQELIDQLMVAFVIALALSRHGGKRLLDPESDEAMAGSRDLFGRMMSTSMSFMWVSNTIAHAMIECLDRHQVETLSLQGIDHAELDALLRWSRQSMDAEEPVPLCDGEPGFALGVKIADLWPEPRGGLLTLFGERDVALAPLRRVEQGLLIASVAGLATRTHLALLEIVDRLNRAGQISLTKGTLFEITVDQVLTWFLGDSELTGPPFEITLLDGTRTDLDVCWKSGNGWLVGECKSYVPSREVDDAYTKLDKELNLVADQLGKRGDALRAGRPVSSGRHEVSLADGEELVRIGIVIDPAHELTVVPDAHGAIHVFTAEGLVAALVAFEGFAQFGQYLTFRKTLLGEELGVVDECDILISFLRNEKFARYRLPHPASILVPIADKAAWRSFLVSQPIEVQ